MCHETPSFGATAWHAGCIDIFSATMRSSTRRTTRSFASWSNFLGTFQIFPSTQTEQNLGHFTQAFRNDCSSLGVRQSMGAVGTSADNALAESFNATLKREVLRDRKLFESPISCRQEVFRWCMGYNTRRRHSWCNLVAPDVFEAETSATLTKAA